VTGPIRALSISGRRSMAMSDLDSRLLRSNYSVPTIMFALVSSSTRKFSFKAEP
jgi:hypothetical protein